MKSLTLEKEKALILGYRNGLIPFEVLLKQYQRLVDMFMCKGLPEEYHADAKQEAYIAIHTLSFEYDINRGTKFVTFILSRLRGVKTTFLREHQRDCRTYDINDITSRLENGGDDPIRMRERIISMAFDKLAANYNFELDEFKTQFEIAIASLTELEKDVIILVYFKEMERKAAAKLLGKQPYDITRAERKALIKLKLAIMHKNFINSVLEGI